MREGDGEIFHRMNLNIPYVPKCPQTDLGTNGVTTITKRFLKIYIYILNYIHTRPLWVEQS